MEFVATTKDLKKALSIVSMAVGEGAETITGHTLFDIKDGQVFLYSTDNDRMAVTYLPVSDISEGNAQFTANPKKIHKLIGGSDLSTVKFSYDKDTKTLNIYASENSDAYISFASFDPDTFLSFDKDITGAKEVKTINAKVLLSGIKFIQGFLPADDKNKKYSNLYITDGIMYGSNGSFKIGAFQSSELQGTSLTLRRYMVSPVMSLIDITGTSEIVFTETDNITIVSSKDELSRFAFRKTTTPIPKMPISINPPEVDCISIDRPGMSKKLQRLSITVTNRPELGIKMSVDNGLLSMETITDRKSFEKIPCKRVVGDSPLEFLLECNRFKEMIDLFISPTLSVYVDKTLKCVFYDEGLLSIEEEGKEVVTKDYKAIGLLTQAKRND